jgi:hypothetical protein
MLDDCLVASTGAPPYAVCLQLLGCPAGPTTWCRALGNRIVACCSFTCLAPSTTPPAIFGVHYRSLRMDIPAARQCCPITSFLPPHTFLNMPQGQVAIPLRQQKPAAATTSRMQARACWQQCSRACAGECLWTRPRGRGPRAPSGCSPACDRLASRLHPGLAAQHTHIGPSTNRDAEPHKQSQPLNTHGQLATCAYSSMLAAGRDAVQGMPATACSSHCLMRSRPLGVVCGASKLALRQQQKRQLPGKTCQDAVAQTSIEPMR